MSVNDLLETLRTENLQLRENLAFAQQRAADNDLRARIGEDKIRELTAQYAELERCELIRDAEVERLRAEELADRAVILKQADVIERLRAENQELRTGPDHTYRCAHMTRADAMRPVVDAARAMVNAEHNTFAHWPALIDAVRALDERTGQ